MRRRSISERSDASSVVGSDAGMSVEATSLLRWRRTPKPIVASSATEPTARIASVLMTTRAYWKVTMLVTCENPLAVFGGIEHCTAIPNPLKGVLTEKVVIDGELNA